MQQYEEILHQQELLRIYRVNLALALRQWEEHRDSYIPPKLAHDIDTARANIRIIKAKLNELGVAASDEAEDTPSPDETAIRSSALNERDRRNRARMLTRVHTNWIKGVLEGSLHGVVMVDLGLESSPESVEQP